MDDLGSLPHHLRHLSRSAYYDSKRKGESNDAALLIMGLISVFIGAQMSLKAWGRIQEAKGIRGLHR